MQIHSFPSLSKKDATVLILGTMPGVQSLLKNEYYGHPQNAFWKLMHTIFDAPFTTDYALKKELLLRNKVAVWDVLKACVREGSLDSAIEQEIPNSFELFLNEHPNIEYIVFNGQKAAAYFKKHVVVPNKYRQITMPSTSPANAGISWERKLEAWRVIREV